MNLKYIIILAIFIIAAFYIALQQDTEVLVVEVTLAQPPDNDSKKIISKVSASLSYVTRMEVPKELPLEAPGVTVIVQQDMQEKSGWYSVPIPLQNIYGTYTVKLKLSGKIDKTKPVSILTRVVDPNGRDVSVRANDIMVE